MHSSLLRDGGKMPLLWDTERINQVLETAGKCLQTYQRRRTIEFWQKKTW
jgi:hypothetical protein